MKSINSCRSRWTSLVNHCFYTAGACVGRYPKTTLLLSAALAGLLSLGLLRARLDDNVRDGYTPVDAPSGVEYATMRRFFGERGETFLAQVLVTAVDGGSMLRNESLSAVVELTDFLVEQHTISVDGKSYSYRDVCRPYCQWNYPIKLYLDGLLIQNERLAIGQPLNQQIRLDYPQMEFLGQNITLSKLVFGLEMYNRSAINLTAVSSAIKSAKIVMLSFYAEKSSPFWAKMLDAWEVSLSAEMAKWRSNSSIRPIAVGEKIVSNEIGKVAQRLMPMIGISFAGMLLFSLITVCTEAYLQRQLHIGTAVIAVMVVISPVLAIGACIGTYCAIFADIGSIVVIVPFLVLAIGVDDAFLMLHSWQSLSVGERLSAPPGVSTLAHCLGLVFIAVGPSILITSATNALAFGVGRATSSAPEIRRFCVIAAFGMLADFLFQITFFAGCLTLCHGGQTDTADGGGDHVATTDVVKRRTTVLSFLSDFVDCYAGVLASWRTAVVVVVLAMAYVVAAVYGSVQMRTHLDVEKMLPRDSIQVEVHRLREEYEFKQFLPITILVNDASRLTTDERVVDRISQLIEDFERLPESGGPLLTNVWLRPYTYYLKSWFENSPEEERMANFGEGDNYQYEDLTGNSSDALENVYYEEGSEPQDVNYGYESAVNYSFLLNLERWKEFIDNPTYNAWNATVIWSANENGSLLIHRFAFDTAFSNVASWRTRSAVLIRCRRVAAQYSDLNVSVFESHAHVTDQISVLKKTTVRSVLITFVCTAIVCIVFIPSLNSVIWAGAAIASITTGVIGFAHYWHMYIDPMTMTAILMAVGFSVDYTVHICYHFNSSGPQPPSSPTQRLARALRAVGGPLLQAGASTLLAVLPLLFVRCYTSEVFAKIVFLVVAGGLLHGLLVLPVLLTGVPALTNWIYRQIGIIWQRYFEKKAAVP